MAQLPGNGDPSGNGNGGDFDAELAKLFNTSEADEIFMIGVQDGADRMISELRRRGFEVNEELEDIITHFGIDAMYIRTLGDPAEITRLEKELYVRCHLDGINPDIISLAFEVFGITIPRMTGNELADEIRQVGEKLVREEANAQMVRRLISNAVAAANVEINEDTLAFIGEISEIAETIASMEPSERRREIPTALDSLRQAIEVRGLPPALHVAVNQIFNRLAQD